MPDDELAFAPAWELAAKIRSKAVSPLELVELFLRRIEALDGELNCYITVAAEDAVAQARQAEHVLVKGEPLPPLHGVPVSLKDTEYTKGIRSTGGSLAFRDFVPSQDSILVERLRRAGAIVLGKTNTPEFAMSGETNNKVRGYCYNPWNPSRTTSGSSGGSAAAIAAGLACLASGSDAGGSITMPAGFCGVFGMKPTHGRVPHWPMPNNWPTFLDSGPITRTVRDAALMLGVIGGYDPREPLSLREGPRDYLAALDGGIPSLRIAFSPDLGYAKVDPEVRAAVENGARVFESLECVVEEASPEIPYPFPIWHAIARVEEFIGFGHLLEEHAEELWPEVRRRLEAGRDAPAVSYGRALQELRRFQVLMSDFFQTYDLLITPTNAVPAFEAGKPPTHIAGQEVPPNWEGFSPFPPSANMTGQPSASVPCGFSSEGLPIGMFILGPWGRDDLLLAACAAFEEAMPWKGKMPALARVAPPKSGLC